MIFHVWLDVRLIKQLIDPTLMTTAAAPELSWRLCHYHTINSTNMFTVTMVTEEMTNVNQPIA